MFIWINSFIAIKYNCIKNDGQDRNDGIDNITRYEYDWAGNKTTVTDNQGRRTSYQYDLSDRMIRMTDKSGGITRQFYDRDGQVVKMILPKEYDRAGEEGADTSYSYDALGRLTEVYRADGFLQERLIYDRQGRIQSSRDGSGRGISYSYDLSGRRTKAETAGGASQSYEYDALDNITRIVDGEGNQTQYILDKWGRIVELKKADGSNEYYGYDYAGNIIRSTDGEGHTTQYQYNSINKLACITDPAGDVEEYAYDVEERLCRKTDRNGIETAYTYNMYGNLLIRRAGKLSECYQYTQEGLLSDAISAGMRYHYEYDGMDRLVKKSASGRTLLSYGYDKNGNILSQTDVT